MDRFDLAVAEQLKTMDRLLFLQSEIERCQKVERQLSEIQEAANMLRELKKDISQLKEDLRDIQLVFENQTEEAIKSYHFQESN
ncbi:putative dinucleotide-utilizing enzyme [Bacillus tianshenii]|uniref:Dinucleotide-utilizing enzyme n=1 Tax=Sutcliffiella tianshenii TaxID=1463404 RepID=A0ABS2NY62_9BACI|nr:YgaB family protein [Bacillus tianshenii]MBM7619590.1 putative dinucleotide-utilizing enzyme [Bacillus tianshenii]